MVTNRVFPSDGDNGDGAGGGGYEDGDECNCQFCRASVYKMGLQNHETAYRVGLRDGRRFICRGWGPGANPGYLTLYPELDGNQFVSGYGDDRGDLLFAEMEIHFDLILSFERSASYEDG